MKPEIIKEIRQALEQATRWTYDSEATGIFVEVEKLRWRQVMPPREMMSTIPAACLLLDHAPALLDEIERLKKQADEQRCWRDYRLTELEAERDEQGKALQAATEKLIELKAERDEQNEALQAATERLIELNIENGKLKIELEACRRADANLNQALNEGDGSYRP